jgi:hypothetical protein
MDLITFQYESGGENDPYPFVNLEQWIDGELKKTFINKP